MSKKEREGLSKRQQFREKRRRAEQRNRIIVIGAVVLLAVVVAFVLIYPQVKPVADVAQVTPVPRTQVNGTTYGDPNAPVKLTEFSDFQCPFCKQFWSNTEPQIEDAYVKTGKVQFVDRSAGNWVSRNAPGNTESQDAAMAAYCAADQNKYWVMHDALFANNQDLEDAGAFATRRLQAIARSVGLDMNAYNSCMSSNKYLDQVNKDAQDFQQEATASAVAANPQSTAANASYGTPFFTITYTVNGQTKTDYIDGAQPFSAFQQKLDAALAAAGAK